MAGSVFEDIAGMIPLGAEDVRGAPRAAAFESDIGATPMDLRVRTMAPSPGVGPLGHGRAAFFDSGGGRRFVRRLLGQGHDIAPG